MVSLIVASMIYLQSPISIQMDMLAVCLSPMICLCLAESHGIWQGVLHMKKGRLVYNQKYIARYLATSPSMHLN